MDRYREMMKSMLDSMIQERSDCMAELMQFPTGTLWKAEKNGHPAYYWAHKEGDMYVRRGISKNYDMQRQLARKAYLSKTVKILDRNINQLSRTLSRYEPLETGIVVSRLAKAYQELPGEYFQRNHKW